MPQSSLRELIAQRYGRAQRNAGFVQHAAQRLSRRYNAVIKFRVFKGLRDVPPQTSRAADTARASRRPGGESWRVTRLSCDGLEPACRTNSIIRQEEFPLHGAVRQRNPPGKPRSRDAAFLPRLRDERDRGARAAGRARRPEAGASARAVRDARGEQRLEPALREVRARRRRRASASTTRTATSAIYDALVRMAQDFSLRYPLDRRPGQLRLGRRRHAGGVCATPSAGCRRSPASCSPTSTRKRSISSPNYDGKELEPTVLPSRLPNLLVNGSSGIAVGMATNIPPHNLTEVVDALPRAPRQPDDHASTS